jgi:glucose-1-phosphate cytidylyltransferase
MSSDLGRIPVMILCGGQGSRLREETGVRPKPMVEIGGRPILWHIMKLYAWYGFRDFILCLGYKGHVIREYFLNYKAYNADLTVKLGAPTAVEYHSRHSEEDWRVTLVETGLTSQTGARVARAGRYVESETFCLTYGDGVGNVDIAALLRFHRKHGKLGTVTGVRPPGRFG